MACAGAVAPAGQSPRQPRARCLDRTDRPRSRGQGDLLPAARPRVLQALPFRRPLSVSLQRPVLHLCARADPSTRLRPTRRRASERLRRRTGRQGRGIPTKRCRDRSAFRHGRTPRSVAGVRTVPVRLRAGLCHRCGAARAALPSPTAGTALGRGPPVAALDRYDGDVAARHLEHRDGAVAHAHSLDRLSVDLRRGRVVDVHGRLSEPRPGRPAGGAERRRPRADVHFPPPSRSPRMRSRCSARESPSARALS